MYCAYVTTLNGVRKHENADRLKCATVFGNNVVIGLDYEDGEPCSRILCKVELSKRR